MQARVDCISSSTYAERPIGFIWGESYLRIREIIARWRTPDEQCFRILTANGERFELRYNFHTDQWQIDSQHD